MNMLLIVAHDVEVNPEIPWKQSKAVSGGNDPVPRHDEFGSSISAMVELHRIWKENVDRQLNRMRNHFDRQDKKVGRTYGKDKSDKSAFSRPAALSSAATSLLGGRRRTRHEDSQAYGGRCSRSSDKRG